MTGTDHRVVFSREGNFLSEKSVIALARVPHQLMIVSTRGDRSLIKGVQVTIGKTGLRLIADKITGTLYDPETGRSLSGARTLEGPAPEGYKLPPKGDAFRFGTQPISTKVAPKKRGRPAKPAIERNGSVKVCGSSKHSAKITEADVRLIRGHKPGSTCIYLMTATQAANRFGVSMSTIADIRRRRTWGHVT